MGEDSDVWLKCIFVVFRFSVDNAVRLVIVTCYDDIIIAFTIGERSGVDRSWGVN